MSTVRPRGASPTSREPRKLGNRPVLDGIRGIAVLLVIMFHTDVLHNGSIGVDMFFVLSGFLITALLLEEWEGKGRISLKSFYARRARRLLPALIWVVIAVAIVGIFNARMLSGLGWPVGIQALIALLFVNNLIQTFEPVGHMGVLGPTWSLAQEEQFYLIWPLVLLAALRRGIGPRAIAVALGVLIAGLWLIEPHIDSALPASYNNYYSPIDRSTELMLGCLAAFIWRHRLVRLPSGWVAGLCAAVLLVVWVWLLRLDGAGRWRVGYLGASALAVPMLLMLLQAPNSPVARLLGCGPLRFIGRISYCVYLVHLPLRSFVYWKRPHVSHLDHFLMVAAGAIVLGALSWWLLESRIIARGRRSLMTESDTNSQLSRAIRVTSRA
ncbi:MAG: acyltransferase [Solirubrobacterales bacterium]|nr:acyltransferase [Solirubrobacterales bacterium]